MKKHLFPFQGGVEFLGVNSPLLFEAGGGGGLGFYLFFCFFWVTFALCKTFAIFSNFSRGKKAWFFPTFLLFILQGELLFF